MKYLTCILATLFIISCDQAEEGKESVNCIQAEYDIEFIAVLDDEICFPDGQSFVIKNIEDVFCPCEVVCVWQGELSVLVETTLSNGDKDLFRFGSESFKIDSEIFTDAKIESFTYVYETGELPDCDLEYDPEKVKVILKVVK